MKTHYRITPAPTGPLWRILCSLVNQIKLGTREDCLAYWEDEA